MPVPLRRLATAVAAAVLLGGCGLLDGSPEPNPPAAGTPDAGADGAAQSRQLVQGYLDAMRAKDVAKGRLQLCSLLHPTFDQVATGPNGDFARHFTVRSATIVEVQPRAGKQEVLTAVTVAIGRRRISRALRFTVAKDGEAWCIDGEVPVAAPATAGPSPTPPL